jgi:FtsP/CotA-like multicopper oxidase with cupredoxin domain
MCLNILCPHTRAGGARRLPAPAAARWLVRALVGFATTATASIPLAANAAQTGVPVADRQESVFAHDNTRPAGRFDGDTVTVRLRAASGRWRPEGPDGPVLTVEAFGEEGAALTVPAPLIRVTEGTSLDVSIRNDLPTLLRVHGLCARDGGRCAPMDVQPGSTGNRRFASGRAGTYHYWATSMGAPMPFRELAGAFVVDPPGGAHPDRIFVITEWTSLTPAQLREILSADEPGERFLALKPQLTFVMNGLSWPATERLTYRRGETVWWRVINLSSQTHPMHLHGFYFTVLTTGDGRRDEPVADGEGRRVVTHLLPSGGTMSLRWTSEREGNWLFHCHIMAHVSPERRLGAAAANASDTVHHHHGQHDPSLGMAGMVLGITVLPPDDAPAVVVPPPARRQLTMVVGPARDRTSGTPAMGIAVGDRVSMEADPELSSPGPPLVLRRGEPVDITVVNRLAEPTSIHWHGLEIDSYYDGVHGWSGLGGRTAPMIEPGNSFVVRITPTRAGTFIYHTHLHDYRQLSSGLYGPLIVTEPGETYDPAVDHVLVVGRRNASEASGVLADVSSAVVNGEHTPRWVWRAGGRHRIRLINITPDDIFIVSFLKGDAVLQWRPLTKDGAPVPPAENQAGPARVRIAVGETYDFEYEAPEGRGALWLEVRSASGKWQAQGQVLLR